MPSQNKSFVGHSTKICPVCGAEHGGAVLINRNLKPTLPNKAIVEGLEVCAEHQAMLDEGYVILIGCDESKSAVNEKGNVNPWDAYRTGLCAAIDRRVAEQIFNIPIPDFGLMYTSDEVIHKVEAMTKEATAA